MKLLIVLAVLALFVVALAAVVGIGLGVGFSAGDKQTETTVIPPGFWDDQRERRSP